MGRRRDSQRSRVYTLEEDNWGLLSVENCTAAQAQLDLDKCQELVDICWDRFLMTKNLCSPRVTDGRSRRSACYMPYDHEIRLPKYDRNGWTICHEVAHAIIETDENEFMRKKYRSHGKAFMKIYIHLLSFIYNIPEKSLRQAAKRYRVKYRSSFPIKTNRISKSRLKYFRDKKHSITLKIRSK